MVIRLEVQGKLAEENGAESAIQVRGAARCAWSPVWPY